MCAIVGAVLANPTSEDLLMLHRVFLESKIRGMHATGISYIKNGKVITEKLPVPANEFPFTFAEYVNEDGNLYIIGHCRYSTSDLEYNQPISNDDSKSVVHNGVITQELPENWKQIYGYDCVTKNDSELVLHSNDPLVEFSHMSMGVCELNANKTMKVYRNGKRPLYLSATSNGCIITSTRDIAKRANVKGITEEVPMNTYLTFDENLAMHVEQRVIADAVDLQHYEFC
jgi:glutamine phosphoribosylpyrophosphate amidotransferase